jgi:asparagine synthase (glutamine-hydrolysing)
MYSELISNFLTIRYNPKDKSFLNPITPKNFQRKISDPSGIKTEKILKEIIKEKFSNTDNTISVSLSSGIDSTLCLGLLRNTLPDKKIVGICGVFEGGFDESKIAREVAEKFDAGFKICHMSSVFSSMPKLIEIAGVPKWNTYQHLIAKEAKKYGNNLVTGDGADEIFGGYTFRYDKFLHLLKPKMSWKEKTLNYLECHNRDWVPDQNKLFNKKIKFNWNKIHNNFKKYFLNELTPIEQVFLADFNGKLLYDFIPSGKKIYTHYGINGTGLFLDTKIIDIGLRLKIEEKYDFNKNIGKIILRNISKRLKIKHIDAKKGFSPGLLLDWKKQGNDICQKILLEKNSNIYKKDWIDYLWVKKAFCKVNNDGDIRYLNRLISILAVEIWCRIFITKEMKSNEKL